MLWCRSRRGLTAGTTGHTLETPRQLKHLRAEGVKGGHGRGWRLAFRQPELVGVEGGQFRVGRRTGSVLRRAAAATRALVQEIPLPGAPSIESCKSTGPEIFSNLLQFFSFFFFLENKGFFFILEGA